MISGKRMLLSGEGGILHLAKNVTNCTFCNICSTWWKLSLAMKFTYLLLRSSWYLQCVYTRVTQTKTIAHVQKNPLKLKRIFSPAKVLFVYSLQIQDVAQSVGRDAGGQWRLLIIYKSLFFSQLHPVQWVLASLGSDFVLITLFLLRVVSVYWASLE